jgi:hypothetical protein
MLAGTGPCTCRKRFCRTKFRLFAFIALVLGIPVILVLGIQMIQVLGKPVILVLGMPVMCGKKETISGPYCSSQEKKYYHKNSECLSTIFGYSIFPRQLAEHVSR